MDNTPTLGLPLVQPSQAQKHVTVNEALTRLDGLVQMRLASRSIGVPPAPVPEGTCHAVPAGATGAWAGQEGQLAMGSGGGWVFVEPKEGWSGWVVDEGRACVFRGGSWGSVPMASAGSGAAARMETVEAEHVVVAGAAQDTALVIPAKAMVFAVAARVLDPITGTATGWRLGTAGAADRFGAGLGLAAGSYADGILGTPTTYYGAEAVRVAPEGGDFAGGRLRLALHCVTFDLPGI